MFIWNQVYTIGNESVDDQHKKLFSILNDLVDAIKTKKAKDILDKTIEELSNYTFYHFSAEEDYMEKIGYPELEDHKTFHKDLIEQLSDICNRIYGGHIDSTDELYRLLKDWIINHILNEDLKIKLFLESNTG